MSQLFLAKTVLLSFAFLSLVTFDRIREISKQEAVKLWKATPWSVKCDSLTQPLIFRRLSTRLFESNNLRLEEVASSETLYLWGGALLHVSITWSMFLILANVLFFSDAPAFSSKRNACEDQRSKTESSVGLIQEVCSENRQVKAECVCMTRFKQVWHVLKQFDAFSWSSVKCDFFLSSCCVISYNPTVQQSLQDKSRQEFIILKRTRNKLRRDRIG